MQQTKNMFFVPSNKGHQYLVTCLCAFNFIFTFLFIINLSNTSRLIGEMLATVTHRIIAKIIQLWKATYEIMQLPKMGRSCDDARCSLSASFLEAFFLFVFFCIWQLFHTHASLIKIIYFFKQEIIHRFHLFSQGSLQFNVTVYWKHNSTHMKYNYRPKHVLL